MPKFSLPLTRLIHENISIMMSFSFSRRPLEQLIDAKFQGEWKYLRKAIFEIPEARAEKACIELAMFIRFLDDEEGFSEYLKQKGNIDFGRLVLADQSSRRLTLRDVCNKIIHASYLTWNFSDGEEPILICVSQEPNRWLNAEIDLINLATFCGGLMS